MAATLVVRHGCGVTAGHSNGARRPLITSKLASSRSLSRGPKGGQHRRNVVYISHVDYHEFQSFPQDSVGIPAANHGRLCGGVSNFRVGSFGLPLLPREFVGIPAGNRGIPSELGIITVGSYETPRFPWVSVGVTAGSRGHCRVSQWVHVGYQFFPGQHTLRFWNTWYGLVSAIHDVYLLYLTKPIGSRGTPHGNSRQTSRERRGEFPRGGAV